MIDNKEHLALIKGVISNDTPTLVRVHPFDLMTDVLGKKVSNQPNGKLFKAMKKISNNKNGVLILLNDSHEDFLTFKLKSSFNANDQDNYDVRNYGIGAQILSDLGVTKMILLSNSQKIAGGIKGFGLSVKKWEKLE